MLDDEISLTYACFSLPTYKHCAGKSSLGAKSITTKNLNVVASGTFALKDTIILQNLDGTTAQKWQVPRLSIFRG